MDGNCIHVTQLAKVVAPTLSSKVYKDECTLCFGDVFGGLDVCLLCFNGACDSHSQGHFKRTGHSLVLRLKCTRFEGSSSSSQTYDSQQIFSHPPNQVQAKTDFESVHPENIISTQAVGQENATGSNEALEKSAKYPKIKADKIDFLDDSNKVEYMVQCIACNTTLICGSDSENAAFIDLARIAKTVAQDAMPARERSALDALQAAGGTLTSCEHTVDHHVADRPLTSVGLSVSSLKCSSCEISQNLWICLTCGTVGCGRTQYDGTGGKGHGIDHWRSSGHAVAVKIGTITPTSPDGEIDADVHCYICDELRICPNLGKSLAELGFFPVNGGHSKILSSEKRMSELQLEQNQKLDLESSHHSVGKPVECAPSLVGLENLGNSCYVSSIIQMLLRIPSFSSIYSDPLNIERHQKMCRRDASVCVVCQMNKLAFQIMKVGGKKSVAPWMLRRVLVNGHSEFSSGRQQDAAEFMMHFFKVLQRSDPEGGAKVMADSTNFYVGQELKCTNCLAVIGKSLLSTTTLDLNIPGTVEQGDYLPGCVVPLSDCLNFYFAAESIKTNNLCKNCECPSISKQMHLLTTPDALILVVSRTTIKDWIPIKMDVRLGMEESLDLSTFVSREPDSFSQSSKSSEFPDLTKPAIEESVDEEMLQMLQSMGFSQQRCRRAIIETGGITVEMAAEWLFEHADEPIEENFSNQSTNNSNSSNTVDESSVKLLMEAGFSSDEAIKALNETNMDIERAFDFLLSHQSGQCEGSMFGDGEKTLGEYKLASFVSHSGASMHCGHYVCWVKDEERWLLFNDSRITEMEKPDFSDAYILLYLRKS